MEQQVKDFAEKVHKLGTSHVHITGIFSTTQREDEVTALHRQASLLVRSLSSEEKLRIEVSKTRAQLQVAYATNAIGKEDIDILLDDLEKIEEGIQ